MTAADGRPARASAILLVFTAIAPVAADDPGHETRPVAGWTLHVRRTLLAARPHETARAVEILERQLAEIVRVMPAPAVASLRETPLWFSPEYPGVPPRAEFHPDAAWLRAHGRDPAMAGAVEFTNVRVFAEEGERMPNFTLHELAHAHHFRVLGFDHPAIREAFERARAGGLYEAVVRHNGSGRPRTRERAYAMTDDREYFAETTEAFFSRNDYFPFTRKDLRAHDPHMVRVLETAWGVAPAAIGSAR